MHATERLLQIIDERRAYLRARVPHDRAAAVSALVRAQNRLPLNPTAAPVPDLVTGHHLPNLGGNLALHLCLTAPAHAPHAAAPADDGWERWATWFRHECSQLAEAELVLTHCETGFMRLDMHRHDTFDAWIASKRPPTSWGERADIDWWTGWVAQSQQPTRNDGKATQARTAVVVSDHGKIAAAQVQQLTHQLGYSPDAVIGGSTVQRYLDVLRWLIERALDAQAHGTAGEPQSESTLITALAASLRVEPVGVRTILAAFTLDADNAADHAAVPGVAAAPLIRVAPDRVILSLHGLTTEPLRFLTRELRRRDAEAYNNAAHAREAVFRDDLYALFRDKRFVTSSSRIELRRVSGDIRTDIDAVVFDRKTGTLGFFELKSQDPYARSTAELTRQRDNFLYANRQVSGVLAWLNRAGAADELLNRVDHRTAQTFRVHRVLPFVLGRHFAHFTDGPEPDRRAAWGTWPQLLRLLNGQPASGANPLASLHTRLSKDPPLLTPPTGGPPQTVNIGDVRLTLHPSLAAMQAAPRK